jgi:hypothetical protein
MKSFIIMKICYQHREVRLVWHCSVSGANEPHYTYDNARSRESKLRGQNHHHAHGLLTRVQRYGVRRASGLLR